MTTTPLETAGLLLSEIRMRDPFILETEPDAYVLFGTSDENLWGGPATGFDCFTSTDLEHWQGPFAAFRPPADFWSDTQYWAPEVFCHEERFYLFATFASSETRVRGVAVLVSERATGPYLPWSDGPVTPPEFPCLDGTLFIDDAAEPWLVFSRGAEGGPDGAAGIADGEMYAQRMSADLRAPLGSPELLFRASSAPWSRPLTFPEGVEPPAQLRLAKDPLFTDGPFLLRSPAGRLQMLWSSFGEQGYAMGVATSDSGTVLGPWSQEPEPLWAVNGGHGMIFTPSGGSSRLVFHSPNDSPAERVTLVPVDFSADELRLADCG